MIEITKGCPELGVHVGDLYSDFLEMCECWSVALQDRFPSLEYCEAYLEKMLETVKFIDDGKNF